MRTFMTAAMSALATAVVLAGCGSSTSTKSTTQASGGNSTSTSATGTSVKAATNSSLGATVLVNAQGMTLYSLSAERGGKFICVTSGCEAIWHPVVASGGAPTGVESLGTTKRPDGQEQVTYKGMPLYTFAQDAKPGDAKGQGIKDVGTWSAVTTSSSATGAPTPSTTTTKSSGGYAY